MHSPFRFAIYHLYFFFFPVFVIYAQTHRDRVTMKQKFSLFIRYELPVFPNVTTQSRYTFTLLRGLDSI